MYTTNNRFLPSTTRSHHPSPLWLLLQATLPLQDLVVVLVALSCLPPLDSLLSLKRQCFLPLRTLCPFFCLGFDPISTTSGDAHVPDLNHIPLQLRSSCLPPDPVLTFMIPCRDANNRSLIISPAHRRSLLHPLRYLTFPNSTTLTPFPSSLPPFLLFLTCLTSLQSHL